jgi:hypothetical protein
MTVVRRVALVAAALAAASVVVACTDAPEAVTPPAAPVPVEESEPPAPLGLRAGVVLPPADALDPRASATMRRDLERLAAELAPELRGVEVLVPASAAFVADLTALLADRGTPLVCVLGPGATEVVRAERDLHPDLHFCATPVGATPDLPAEVLGLDVRIEELGYVVGAAAAAADDGPVGLVLGSAELTTGRFRAGVEAGLGDREVVLASGEPGEAVEEVLAAGATVVVLDPAGDAEPALQRLAVAGVPVLSPAALVTGRPTARPLVVVSWQVHWDQVVAAAIGTHLETLPAPPVSHGFAEDAFTVTAWPGAPSAVVVVVDAVVPALRAGDRDVLGSPPAGPAPADEPERGSAPDLDG